MNKYLFGFVALMVSSCGGAELAPVGALPEQPSVDARHVVMTPASSTGFAQIGDDLQAIQDGTVFTVPSRRIRYFGRSIYDDSLGSVKKEDIKAEFLPNGDLKIPLAGNTYVLPYDETTKSFVTSDRFDTVSVIIMGRSPYARSYRADVNRSSVFFDRYEGVVGYSTDPSTLPARADYQGRSLLMVSRYGRVSDAADGTAALTANFAAATLEGKFSFDDPIGDAAGSADIGKMTGTLKAENPYYDGSDNLIPQISGNVFDTKVTFAQNDMAALGVASVTKRNLAPPPPLNFPGDPNTPRQPTPPRDPFVTYTPSRVGVTGGFFGPNGEVVAGTGSSRYDASSGGTIDIGITFEATKK